MIKELRVDDRLIHGQVALTWPGHLETSHIVVANDEASKNEMQQSALKMSVQGTAKVLVRNIDNAIKLFQNPKAQSIPMFVVVNKVKDAQRIYEGLNRQGVERINIANVGRFDGIDKNKKTELTGSILLTLEDKEATKALINANAKVVHQVIPTDKAEAFSNILKEH